MNRILIAAASLVLAVSSCTPPDAKPAPKEEKPAGDATKPKEPTNMPQANDIPAPPDVAAPPADAQKTASGLASKVVQPGTGKDHPAAVDTVEVHYTGWTTDGHMFDSSVKRGHTAKFPLNRVIKGWTEGVQLMVEGEKRRFWIPAELAYGDKPSRPGAPTGQLTFDVELVKIIPAPKPLPVPATPADVAAPPKDAKKTASGLSYKVITPGTGKDHPTPQDTVEVHYAGWTTDGKMFDNSYERGATAKFPLGGVIKGWTEGVQLMTVGEKARFWIPAAMAYGDKPMRPGAPSGNLTFDIELIAIQGK